MKISSTSTIYSVYL